MDLWERCLQAGLVWDDDVEGAAQEGRAAFGGEEEDDAVSRSYHHMLMYGKLRQTFRRATDR